MNRKLKLVSTEPRPIDTRIALVHEFNQVFQTRTGHKNPMTFGACMNALNTFKYVDEGTGEEVRDLPDLETWQEQLNGFFDDPFARDNRAFHFTYFIKQFGSFVKFTPIKKQSVVHSPKLSSYVCPDCGKVRTDAECSNEGCMSNEWKSEKGTKEEVLGKLEQLANHMRAR